MSLTCPNGHLSQAEDFCDTCGAPIDHSAQPQNASAAAGSAGGAAAGGGAGAGSGGGAGEAGIAAAGATSAGQGAPSVPSKPAGQECPNCHVENSPTALFCEACGYDFTTGAMPRGASGAVEGPGGATEAAVADWVAEVWVDPEWYDGQETDEPCPSAGLPTIIGLHGRSLLIGRHSASRAITPDIDCGTDSGVSRRHAQLTSDGTRWFVEDLGSANGTFVGEVAGALPHDPIPVGPKKELDHDDRVYVGAWTRIVIRPATDDEKAAASA